MTLQRHHRRKGDRSDERPVNILLVDLEVHDWIEKHPEEARELGWSVSRYEAPEEVSITIPKTILSPSKPRKPRAKEKARDRRVVSHSVPQDVREDGAGVYDDLLDQCRERLEEDIAVGGKSWQYQVLVAVMYDWLTNH